VLTFGAATALAINAKDSSYAASPIGDVLNPAYIDTRIDSRSISFENPAGERGAGGKIAQGRKGRPLYVIDSGEKVVLAEIKGSGTVRHIWVTLGDQPPEVGRALRMPWYGEGEVMICAWRSSKSAERRSSRKERRSRLRHISELTRLLHRDVMTLADGYLQLGTLLERRDDYCTTAFVYTRHPQRIQRYDTVVATADIAIAAAS